MARFDLIEWSATPMGVDVECAGANTAVLPHWVRPAAALRQLGAALLAVLIVAGACGSDDEVTFVAPTPVTVVDPATGESVEVPDDFTLDFGDQDPADPDEDLGDVLPQGPRPTAPTGPVDGPDPDQDPPGAGDDEGTRPGGGRREATTHPLEQLVIETTEVDREAPPVMDEAADLACANTEFARDALIEADEAAADSFAAAGDWAAKSGYVPVNLLAADLAAAPTGDAATEVVIAVLEACAAAGYEL